MRQPIEMLIQILANGGRIQHDGHQYAMGEDGSLCAVFYTGNGMEIGISLDATLAGVKKLADSIGKEELWLQCCAMKLKEENE